MCQSTSSQALQAAAMVGPTPSTSDDLGYHLFDKNLFCQFGLLVRHEFLSDIGQEVEVTLVLLEDVGDEFAAVHAL